MTPKTKKSWGQLPQDLKDKLNRFAQESGLKKAKIMEFALREYLDRNGKDK